MAIYKFYNIQLLPIDTKTEEVGVEGYCRLFEELGNQIREMWRSKHGLPSIAIRMRGDMYFAPYSVSIKEYPSDDSSAPNKAVYGSFLKFDDIDALYNTQNGNLEYQSQGNTSSKRFEFEFVFDPIKHVLAIHDAKGLPTRNPLIGALKGVLERHTTLHFKMHSLEVEELTTADSVISFFEKPKRGISSYKGSVSFSNSDEWDNELGNELLPAVEEVEKELKEKSVGNWKASFTSFKNSVMTDLPMSAKIQMLLATRYGNAEASYLDENGQKQKYQMEDYPVRESLEEKVDGNTNRVWAILGLIGKALRRTRESEGALSQNKRLLPREKTEDDS
ncbi:DUF4747 family protein [Vibrio rhizosphaerae]|uniref:DUF4747 family protein n=1 Tax=Vibrio rhizosphaerae TaxID=398736 RepID=A0ABU4IZB8_9VIBR|nr:DUF4747 family protein [Vibrio rhizosphaerae]MDW6094071.1 DUF4747 family protein [Vibrio rhizosphaerae]